MESFQDSRGRTWDLVLNGFTVKLLRSRLALNVWDIKTVLEKLQEDGGLFCDALWVLCAEQGESRKIAERDFFEAIDADVKNAAETAFMREFANFSRTPMRGPMRKMLQKQQELVKAQEARLNTLTEEEMTTALQKLNSSSGTSPDSSASLRMVSPGDNSG